MFGISLGELLLVGAIALMIVGPQRLPKMLGAIGRFTAKLRRITTEVRHQTGIDEILREEGLKGGLNELRGLMRPKGAMGTISGALAATSPSRSGPSSRTAAGSKTLVAPPPVGDPFRDVPHDLSREYPPEGCDAYGCLPDDLWLETSDESILEPAQLEPKAKTPEPPAASDQP